MRQHIIYLLFPLFVSTFLKAQYKTNYTLTDTTRANSLLQESIDLYGKGKYERALAKTDSAKYIYKLHLGDSSKEISDAFYHSGFINLNTVKYENALKDFQTSLSIREKQLGKTNRDVAFSYNAIGIVHYEKGEFPQALFHFEKAMSIRIKLFGENHPDVASSFNNIANCYADKGNTDKALSYFEKALKIQIMTTGDTNLKASMFLKNIGRCYFDKGDYDKALTYHKKALKIRIDLLGNYNSDVAISYYNIGNCCELKGDFHKALSYYNKSLHILLKINDTLSPNIAMAYGNIGNAYLFLKEYDQAVKFQKIALDIRLKIFGKKHPNVATNLVALGLTHLEKGDYFHSIEYYNKSKSIAIDIFGEGSADEANSYFGLGRVNMRKGDYQTALLYFDKFYDIITKTLGVRNPSIAQIFMFKGECYKILGDFEKAIIMFEKSMSYNLYALDSNFSNVRSLNYLIEALSKMGSIYNNPIFSKKNSAKSLDYCKQAMAAINYLNSNLTTDGGRNLVKNQNYQTYEEAIKSNLFLVGENKKKEIFEYMEQSKAGNLLAQIKETDALQYAGIPDSILQKEYNLRIDITWLEKQRLEKINAGKTETDSTVLVISSKLFDLQQQYDTLKTHFETHYPQYYRLKYNLHTLNVEEVQQKLLTADQTLLSYFVGDSSIFMFVVNKNNYSVHETPKDSLEEWVKKLRFTIYDNKNAQGIAYEQNAQNYTDIAYKLYEKLIAPVKNKLLPNLIIVPDGVLGYVPFEVLLAEKPITNFDRFQLHHYLLRDFTISYNYSATLWQEMKNRKNTQNIDLSRNYRERGLIAFAPTFSKDTLNITLNQNTDFAMRSNLLSRLKYNIPEVQAIQRIMGGKIYTGKYATKVAFLREASKYQIIHLATHGKADDRMGDYAFLSFQETHDSLADERLYVKDLYNCTLNADMVVLSACETGIGQLQRGEGIISLARAFAYSGAKSIVTTLWAVEDESTKTLMESFYKHLKNGQTKDAALRQAKLDYLRQMTSDNAAPFRWAGFIAMGDMQAIKK